LVAFSIIFKASCRGGPKFVPPPQYGIFYRYSIASFGSIFSLCTLALPLYAIIDILENCFKPSLATYVANIFAALTRLFQLEPLIDPLSSSKSKYIVFTGTVVPGS
jgi:hypothetical protein